MLSKEEIEKLEELSRYCALKNIDREDNIFGEFVVAIQKIENYIEQLESDKQKLIEKLKKDNNKDMKADNKQLEEAIKILNIYLSNSSYKEKDNEFFKGSGWEVVDLEIPKSIETVLKELERLQEENSIQRKQLNDAFSNGFIHKDKIREKLEELRKEYKEALEENSTKAFILKCQITILEELLEGK